MNIANAPGPGQIVFLVEHAYDVGDDAVNVKIVGVYATHEDAERAVERMRTLPGFRDHPEGFTIDPYRLNDDVWDSGFESQTGP